MANTNFLRELIDGLRSRFGRSVALEFRMDAAFFQENLLKLLERRGCFYALTVPFCQWSKVRAAVAAQHHWQAVQPEITCFETRLQLKVWALELRVVVFGKRVAHQSRRTYQLDLFSPDDGPLRILGRGHQPAPGPARIVKLYGWPRGPREDLC